MKPTESLESGVDAALKGAVRVFLFLLLIAFFVPSFVGLRLFRPKSNPFLFCRFLYRCIVRTIGIRVRVHGTMTETPSTLFVSNHTSYMDVIVLGSVIPAAFVAKAEVAHWPFFGPLARLQHTAFIERRSVRAADQRTGLSARLAEGDSLILFPEGTSTDGQRTLPFKSSLFSVAEKPLPNGKAVTIQPVSTVCTEIYGLPAGRIWRRYYAWFGDMTLLKHLWAFFCIGHFTVDIVFHPPVTIRDFANRKALADYSQNKVAQGVDACLKGRSLTKEKERLLLPSSATPEKA